MGDTNPDTTTNPTNHQDGDAAAQASQEPATGNNHHQAPTDQQNTGTNTTSQPDTTNDDGGAQVEGIDALPEWAQKEIRNLRDGEAKYRTRAKEVEETKEAEKNNLIQQIGKALGLVEDQADDPEALVKAATEREQAAAERAQQMEQQLRDYKSSAAVTKAAGDAKVTDPKLLEAVLRSDNAFTELDINADDYEDQVSQRVAAAIEAHPALAQAATPHTSGVDTSTTNTGAARKLTQEDLTRLAQEGKWDEINEAAEAGRIA